MAREFVKIEDWEEWVPPFDGERDLYVSEPGEAVSMELRFLTKEQREHYQRISQKHQKMGGTPTRSDRRAMRQMFEENVRDIRNYVVDGAPVTTGAELYDVEGDSAMHVAVTAALFERSQLDAGLAKKLRSGSASLSSRRTTSDAGAAADATPGSQTTTKGERTTDQISGFPTEPSEPSGDVTPKPTESPTTGPASTT